MHFDLTKSVRRRNWEQKHNSGTECKERETMYILGLDILYKYFSILTFESCSWRDVLYSTLCDKVCQWLVTGRWFSSGILIFSTNKTDRHDITKILLKVALSTISLPPFSTLGMFFGWRVYLLRCAWYQLVDMGIFDSQYLYSCRAVRDITVRN